jgi:hypothetical protein
MEDFILVIQWSLSLIFTIRYGVFKIFTKNDDIDLNKS